MARRGLIPLLTNFFGEGVPRAQVGVPNPGGRGGLAGQPIVRRNKPFSHVRRSTRTHGMAGSITEYVSIVTLCDRTRAIWASHGVAFESGLWLYVFTGLRRGRTGWAIPPIQENGYDTG